jgi:hypothetical protein
MPVVAGLAAPPQGRCCYLHRQERAQDRISRPHSRKRESLPSLFCQGKRTDDLRARMALACAQPTGQAPIATVGDVE